MRRARERTPTPARVACGTDLTPVSRFAPTLTSAREAHAAGELAAWCQSYLRAVGGNVGIADPLLREDNVYLLGQVALRDVYPCSGPDADFNWPVPRHEFEQRVEAMMRFIQAGWDVPPLFVHMPSLFLADGTHRREALLRLGRANYWAVLWMNRPPLVGRNGRSPFA
jgi:hypothetical protein